MELLDGKLLSSQVKEEIKKEVDALLEIGESPPHLAAVLVGDNPASQSYVKNKIRFCEAVGFRSTLIKRPETISQKELLELIEALNDDDTLDGYIVQLPLPKHIDERAINLAIDYTKDVDGFHPMNFGRMAQGMPAYLPATPCGILEMLKRYKIITDGKKCVVVGRSNIVGSPMSILLGRKSYPGNCTVTMVHSRTQNMEEELRSADIIIAAIGIPRFIKADMLAPGAVVIDVGINRIEVSPGKYKLVGDVDFENVKDKCSFITPVPGGVGPMTVTALMINTLKAAKREIYP
jgi:methylenetetrahydrofolate dehydrogenase (NADP+) / methenyltetrahydrofolate cyclohydrolase